MVVHGGALARSRTALALLTAVLLLFLLTAARTSIHIDTHAAAVEAWHLAATGSPWLEGDLSAEMQKNPFIGEAPNGHVVGLRMAGPVLVALPFYALLNRDPAPEAFSYLPASLAAATATAVAVLLMYLAVRRLVGGRTALMAALAFAFATPTWTVSANMLWTHSLTQLALAGAAYALARDRLWLAGAFFGVAVLGRPHLAVVAAVVGVGLAFVARRSRPMFAVGVPAAVGMAALISWNRWMFGTWSVGGGYVGKERALAAGPTPTGERLPGYLENVAGFLVSPDRGLLVWTPVLLVLVPALVRGWTALPLWTRLLLVGGVAYSLVQLRINVFHGGDHFYGYRLPLELVTASVPALVLAFVRLSKWSKAVLVPLLFLQAGAMAFGALIDGYYVLYDDVWRSNSLWVAFERRPEMVAGWLAACLVAGVMASVVAWRRGAFDAGTGIPSATLTACDTAPAAR